MNDTRWIIPLEQLTIDDVGKAGGKNASLGEMIKHLGSAGVRVPGGFAVTSAAYWHLVDDQGLRPAIAAVGAGLEKHPDSLRSVGATVREAFRSARVSDVLGDLVGRPRLRSGPRDVGLMVTGLPWLVVWPDFARTRRECGLWLPSLKQVLG